MAINYRGTVKLMNGESIVHSFEYTSREERKSIVDRWKRICKSSFCFYNVQVSPLILGDKKKRKETTKTERLMKLQEESKERNNPIVRHGAVYSNLRIYNYDK